MTMHLDVLQRASRFAPAAVATILVVAACGSGDDGTAEQPPPTPVASSSVPVDTAPTTTVPSTEAPATTQSPSTNAPTTPPPTFPADQVYEVIASVIEDSAGPQMCFEVLESLPPQCGTGLQLVDWSWDAITVEMVQDDVTWVDQIYVTGTYDDAAQSLTVDSARIPTDQDRERLQMWRPLPDYSVPCPTPEGGWPSGFEEWPGDEISALDGYAGAWIDEGSQVMTVKFTGDLAAAEAAVREHYAGGLCVVAADHDAAELAAIQEQLHELSSIQVLSTATYVDATGEWVEASTIAPDPARQAALDAEFGPGVVRLHSLLQPLSSS